MLNGYQDHVTYGSAWNESTSLLAAVLRMREKGIAQEEIRIIPHIGHGAQPEIVSRPLQDSVRVNTPDGGLQWLYLNIRVQNRLHWLYPLFHQGQAGSTMPESQLPEQDSELRKLAQQKAAVIWQELFVPNLEPNQQEMDCLETHQWLLDRNPEWIERLGFVASAKGWIQPGYTTPVQWLARLWRTLYPQLTPVPLTERPHPYRLRLAGDRFTQEHNPNQTIQVRDDWQAGRLRDDATLLAEKFFTLLFLHLASIEMLEGVAHPMDWTLDPLGNPFHFWAADKGAKFEQNGLLGGLDLNGVLLRLMQEWMGKDGFLGLTRQDWDLFGDPAAQGTLWALLLERRDIMDYGALFDRAVHLLVSDQAKVYLASYQGMVSSVGTLLAQPGISLVLGGEALLHAPEVIVYLPHDRANEPEAESAQRRLEVLRRLFLPAHIPLRCRWAVDFAVLDETAWLVQEEGDVAQEKLPLFSRLAK